MSSGVETDLWRLVSILGFTDSAATSRTVADQVVPSEFRHYDSPSQKKERSTRTSLLKSWARGLSYALELTLLNRIEALGLTRPPIGTFPVTNIVNDL